MKLLPDNLNYDFVGKRRFFAILSAVIVTICLGLFFTVGPDWGIDFTGGTQVRIKFDDATTIGDVRQSLEPMGLSGDSVQQFGAVDEHEFNIRIQDPSFGFTELKKNIEETLRTTYGQDWIHEVRSEEQVGARMTIHHTGDAVAPEAIQATLAMYPGVAVDNAPDDNTFYVKLPPQTEQIGRSIGGFLGDRKFTVVEVESVGPKTGAELRTQATIAIGLTLLLIFVYVAFRFELSYAPGAFLSLFHDACVVLGMFVIFRREFDLNAIGVVLTVLGYSINDTIVIYDRIRENRQKYRRADLAKLINDSINEMLGRTIATNFTAFLAVVAFLFFGGYTIQTFAIADRKSVV